MSNTFFTWDDFADGFDTEMDDAYDVYTSMAADGLKDQTLSQIDFSFISDSRDKLTQLAEFLSKSYHYQINNIEVSENTWELNGQTISIPITQDNLRFWVTDMYKRGYGFDAKPVGYGAMYDPRQIDFPNFEPAQAEGYFEAGMDCYQRGDLSGALINWSNVLVINPLDPNAYYSRAIVKNELYAWKAALRDYDKALEIAPHHLSALINRGDIKDNHGDHHGAINDYDAVIASLSADLHSQQLAYFNRGNAKHNLKDLQGACADWKQAQALGANYAGERIQQCCE